MRYDEYESDEPLIVIEKHTGSASSFLWGLALGAGLAILFAPHSGEETRRELRRRARRVQTAAQDAAEDLSDSMTDRYQFARRTVEDRLEAARQAVELKKQQASEAIRAGREAAQQARSDLERRIAETKAAYRAGAGVARATRPLAPRVAEDEVDDGDPSLES